MVNSDEFGVDFIDVKLWTKENGIEIVWLK